MILGRKQVIDPRPCTNNQFPGTVGSSCCDYGNLVAGSLPRHDSLASLKLCSMFGSKAELSFDAILWDQVACLWLVVTVFVSEIELRKATIDLVF